jgi:excisionase family DNA binding protein
VVGENEKSAQLGSRKSTDRWSALRESGDEGALFDPNGPGHRPNTRLPGFFLVSEAARQARVSEWTIRREIKDGRLRARRIGRLVRILDRDLAEWMSGEVS